MRLIFDKTGKPNEEYEDFMTGFVKSAIFSSRGDWRSPHKHPTASHTQKYQWAPILQCWQKDYAAAVRELRSFT